MKLLTLDIERREVPGFPGYRASRDGRVWGRRGHELSQFRNPSGYPTVKAGSSGLPVHRAVALAYIPNPERATDVNHMDGNKDNNAPENLEWCSRSQNIRHALATGLHANPETPVIGVNWETGDGVWAKSQSALKVFGFTQANVSKCLHGERPRHKGYQWSFA